MKKLSTLLAILVCSFVGHTQVLYGVVTNNNFEILKNAQVLDTVYGKSVFTDELGTFTLQVRENSVLKFSSVNHVISYLDVGTLPFEDTIYQSIQLKFKVQEINEVIVSSKRLAKIVDQESVNIIDYLAYPEFVVVLKSDRSERKISIEGPDSTIQEYSLGKIKVRSLFEDCYGNIHLLSEDSSYQIWMDDLLYIVSQSTISEFNSLIKPCVANFDAATVFETYSNQNRYYSLVASNSDGSKIQLHQTKDEIGEKVARSRYWEILSYYHAHASEVGNIITNGAWDGNIISLQLPGDRKLSAMITWYTEIRAKEIKVQSFPSEDNLVVFDQFNDSLSVVHHSGGKINQVFYKDLNRGNESQILLDNSTDLLYSFNGNQMSFTLSSINIYTGELTKVLTLQNCPRAKNVQVLDDFVYFLAPVNDFYKLYKIRAVEGRIERFKSDP